MNPAAGRLKSSHSSTTTSQSSIQRITLQTSFLSSIRVGFGPEFVCPDAPYRVIMCKCRKRDVDAFLAAIRELPNKMLLCGHPDYLTFCEDLKKKVQTVRDNGGVLTNETDDTAQKAEQESAKGATCQAAR